MTTILAFAAPARSMNRFQISGGIPPPPTIISVPFAGPAVAAAAEVLGEEFVAAAEAACSSVGTSKKTTAAQAIAPAINIHWTRSAVVFIRITHLVVQ